MLKPLTRYFDGRCYVLHKGQDYTNVEKVRQQLYHAARKKGVKLTTRSWPDRLEVQVEVTA